MMLSSHAPSTAEGAAAASAPLGEIRERLWQALRATHDNAASDVHSSLAEQELSRADMEQLIQCVFCALHSNATAEDAHTAAEAVLKDLKSTDSTAYSLEDANAFLNSAPSRWLPDLMAAQEEAAAQSSTGSALWEEFNAELIDCIVSDEAPHHLLQPSEVLTPQRTTAATELVAPLTDYIVLPPTHAYPPVYDTLFAKLCLDERDASVLSLSQFRLFFNWFHAMHFRNTDLPRAHAAADNTYQRYRDGRGELTITQFQLACEEMCAVYAKRRDAAAYLQQLVRRTEKALASHSANIVEDGESVAAQFFLHPELATLPAWQRDLTDPTQLYLPDELRVVQQEMERYRRHTSPRILLTGPVGVGKTAVGAQLAAALHCVHLDVVELAVAALQPGSDSAVREDVASCLAAQQPLSMATQAALLREAMTSERALYRGYVFSDSIPTTANTRDHVEEQWMQPLRILEEARPDHVVELTCTVPDVYGEYAGAQASAIAAATTAAWAAVSADAERRRQAAEKVQMKAGCEKLLAHLVELEAADPKKPVSPEELEVARQQAVEAQEILDALTAEENTQEDVEAAAAAGAGETEELSAEVAAARAREELRLRIAALVYRGRLEAGVLPTVSAGGAAAASLVPLEAQDWSVCWRKCIDAARSLGRVLAVDPIASGDAAHVVAYITQAFELQPCDLAEALEAAAGEQTSTTTEESRPPSMAEDEERSRIVEDMVAEKHLRPSPTWKRFCPVTAAVDGVLIEGAACHACAYRGCCYYFASQPKRDAFVDHPTRYLREAFPEQRAVLLLADDAIIEGLPELLQSVAEEMAVQLRLIPFTATAYAEKLEPRHALLQSRAAVQEARRKAEAATRKARHDRQEQAAKAQSKKPKGGKLEPTKPKTKRPSSSEARMSSQTSQTPTGKATTALSGGGGRRRVPRAMVVDAPQCMADEKQLLIDAAKERQCESAPLLVTALTAADLDPQLLEKLATQQLLPETVVALSFKGVAGAGSAAERDEDGGAERGSDEDEDSVVASQGNTAASRTASPSTTSVFQRALKLLKTGTKSDWRTAKTEAHEGGGSHGVDLHTIPVSATATVAEVMAELLQQLNPLSIVTSDDAVDEALGEENGEDGGGGAEDDEEDEEQAAEDEALLYPEGTARPAAAATRVTRDPLVKPMRRFLHQFGSRLDYCPVTLHERGILVRGKQEFCLRYVDGLYIFATEEARDAFARCPQRYVGELPPHDVPPRVWVVGATQSGKKTLASGLLEAYRVPFFVYDRQFFEECVEAALTPTGAMVRGVYIPADTKESNPYLKRAFTLLESVHDKEKEEKKRLAEKAEAERLLEEHERLMEEREAREDGDGGSADDEEGEDAAADDWSDEKEAALQEKLEFEPEDEEEKQVRLSEAYLRIASCVTRFRPFDKLGYVMICPPFSDGDLDVLFDEGGIPEVVVRLNVDEEVFNQRSALYVAARRAAAERARAQDVAAREKEAVQQAMLHTREAARHTRARERAVAKWRRRHIGADDADVPSDAEGGGSGEDGGTNGAEGGDAAQSEGEGRPAEAEDEGEAQADRQAQEDALEEFVTFVEERRIEVVKINAAAAKETVRRAVVEALGRHLAYRASLFYHPEVLRPAEATARLASGQCDWSVFGAVDPVRLYAYRREGERSACKWKPTGLRVGAEEEEEEGDDEGQADAAESGEGGAEGQAAEEPEELSEVASDEVEELRNAVRRRDNRVKREAARRVARVHNRLYTFDNDATLLRFVRNPWPFMQAPPPNPPLLHAPVVSVYEPDTRCESEMYGGKLRCLADSIAFNLHAKCVSTSSLLAWGAVHANWQALRIDCMLAAQAGLADLPLTQKLLTLYLCSAEAKASGAVLHNLPVSAESAAALARLSSAAPIVKVMSAFPTEAADADAHGSSQAAAAAAQAVAQAMKEYASVALPLPHPRVPLDSSNLMSAVHGVEAFCANAQEARLREARAFPVPLRDAYEVLRHVQRHLSEFGAFCPYEWVEKSDLVRCFPADASSTELMDLRLGARYLGQYFFFSSPAYLERFLLDPTTVTDTTAARPIPKHLPTAVAEAEAAALPETALALEGCCPVLLYDTRDRRGMRGVRQPLARKGALDCVVEYEGQRYAMLNEAHKARFLRRPWQYTEGAVLPAALRRPLPKGVKPSSITDTEEYLQRQLYDPVAQALLAVGRERPIYPGLSPEESALKYVALYLKAHRDPTTISAFEAESYKASFELFHKRATLYRQLPRGAANGKPAAGAAATAATAAAAAHTTLADASGVSDDFCASYEEVHTDDSQLGLLNHLPNPSDSAWR